MCVLARWRIRSSEPTFLPEPVSMLPNIVKQAFEISVTDGPTLAAIPCIAFEGFEPGFEIVLPVTVATKSAWLPVSSPTVKAIAPLADGLYCERWLPVMLTVNRLPESMRARSEPLVEPESVTPG